MNSKEGLIAKYKGGPKGKAHPGSLVRLTRDVEMGTLKVRRPAGVYEVAYLLDHERGHWDGEIAVIDPQHPGLCFGLPLKDLELAEIEVAP